MTVYTLLNQDVYYPSPANKGVLDIICNFPGDIIDLGCGHGSLGEELKKNGRIADAVTASQVEKATAEQKYRKLFPFNLNDGLPAACGQYQIFVLSHVLEHLTDAGPLMQSIRSHAVPGAVVVAAVPNMLVWENRIKFLKGRIEYSEQGIMDFTHLRWYTLDTFKGFFEHFGMRIRSIKVTGHFPLGPIRRLIGSHAAKIDRLALQHFGGLFGREFLVCADVFELP